jgi:hypothetical protein
MRRCLIAPVFMALALLTSPALAQEAPETTPAASISTPDTALEDHLRALSREYMRQCWRMPANEPQPERLVVTVRFELNEDGSLRGSPRVISPTSYRSDPSMRRAVRNAVRAVRRCAPFPYSQDPIASQHYEAWREIVMTFRPPASSALHSAPAHLPTSADHCAAHSPTQPYSPARVCYRASSRARRGFFPRAALRSSPDRSGGR